MISTVSPSRDAGTKRGLLVGIDAYQRVRPLNGCVNDARLMQQLLSKFGFPKSQLRLLTDGEATRDGLLAALDQLVSETQPNDTVLLYYAGHGSQMPDREGDKPSGMDSTLVPVDSGRGDDPNRDITDDEIALRLTQLLDRRASVTLLIDACHSASITRDATAPAAYAAIRGIEPETRSPAKLPPSPLSTQQRAVLAAHGARGIRVRPQRGESATRGVDLARGSYVLITGCRDNQTASGISLPTTDGSPPAVHGALTWFLGQQLRDAAPGSSYRDVFEEAAIAVTENVRRIWHAEQHPQLEGQVDRELFGTREVVPMRHVRVLEVDGDRIVLATGAALGAAAGSRYAVYPPRTRSTTDVAPLGEIELVAVGATQSEARILSGSVVTEARAVETAPAASLPRLRVAIHDEVAPDAMLRALVTASPLLQVADTTVEPLDARVHLLRSRSVVGPSDPVPQLGALLEPVWAVVNADGELLASASPLVARADVLANLEIVARRKRVLVLRNAVGALADRFDFELLRGQSDGTWSAAAADAEGVVALEEDDRLAFRVRSRHDAPVHINVIDVGATGTIGLLFPPEYAQDVLDPGVESDLVNPPRKQGWRVAWPAGFPFVDGSDRTPVETVRLFVTTEPADFSFLRQTGTRGASGGPAGLGRLLRRAATGDHMRDLVDDSTPDTGDWTTVDCTFTIRHRNNATLTAGTAAAVGSAKLSVTGVSGQATLEEAALNREPSPSAKPLEEAFRSTGAIVRQVIHLDGLASAPPNGRGVADLESGEAAIDVRLGDPGPGLRQLLVSRDSLGRVSFHFPTDEVTASRDAFVARPAVRMQRFRVPVDKQSAPEPTGEGARGLLPSATKLVLEQIIFPLLDPVLGAVGEHFEGAWEARRRPYRVRPFGPEDYARDTTAAIDGEGWGRLGAGRALLFLHGTFSRAHLAFGALPTTLLTDLAAHYGGRIFAFDHYTLSEDPLDNVKRFVAELPEDAALDLDIVCHSRGGLVGRVLAERQSELSLGARTIRLNKVLFVASPNGGTRLADPDRVGTLLDTFATMLNLVPEPMASEILQGVVTVAKQLAVGAVKGLPGLVAMCPGGEFAHGLNAGARDGGVRYFALASDYTPRVAGLATFLETRLMHRVFDTGNDLVVPTDGVWDANGSGYFPIDHRRVLSGVESVAHTEFFASPAAQTQLLEWLHMD